MDSELFMRKFSCPDFIFGADARFLVSRSIHNLHIQRIFLATDHGIQKSGWVTELEQIIKEQGLSVFTFSNISSNPRDYEVMEGAFLFQENHCDGIVALGGGSVIDAAKGIGVVVSNGDESILNFAGIDRIQKPMPPFVAIPTTSGTAADISRFAIINDTTRKTKIALVSQVLIPDISLIDPKLLFSMDKKLTICTGIDALTHAVEAYVSSASSSFTDHFAESAIKLLWEYLPKSIQDPEDMLSREKVMEASTLAGMAFSNAGLGAVHSCAHSLGGFLDLHHGECNALMLPHVVVHNFSTVKDRYLKIAEWINSDANSAEQLAQTFFSFGENMGIKRGLRFRGVTNNDLAILAKHAAMDACNATNPKYLSSEEYLELFQEAL